MTMLHAPAPGKRNTGELCALIAVEDVRLAIATNGILQAIEQNTASRLLLILN